MESTNHVPATVEEYLAIVPQKQREVLQKLRDTIKAVVPQAQEVISYQIPTFKYHGSLVAYAAFKNHCSFFVMSGSLLDHFESEPSDYRTSKSTLQFGIDKPIPEKIIKKLVKARMAENEARSVLKEERKVATKKIKK